MDMPKVYDSEYRFCCILWAHEPVTSRELVRLCAEQLQWKKSTTYTVIKRLAERGVLKTEHAVVVSLVSKDAVQRAEGRAFLDKTFDGSMAQFFAAFARDKALSADEVAAIRRLIDTYEEE